MGCEKKLSLKFSSVHILVLTDLNCPSSDNKNVLLKSRTFEELIQPSLKFSLLNRGAMNNETSFYRLDFNGFYTERLEKMAIERSQKTAA